MANSLYAKRIRDSALSSVGREVLAVYEFNNGMDSGDGNDNLKVLYGLHNSALHN